MLGKVDQFYDVWTFFVMMTELEFSITEHKTTRKVQSIYLQKK